MRYLQWLRQSPGAYCDMAIENELQDALQKAEGQQ
jgi:hypothetical protein